LTARLRPQFRKLRAALAAGSRRSARFLLRASAGLAAVYLVFAVILPFVRTHEYFRLRSIRVTCDHPAVSPKALAAVAGLWSDRTIWQVDVARAESALGDIPWVRRATVTRRFPWHVSVHVERRHPIAATLVGDGVFLVDETGAVFREPGKKRTPDLVFLRGWNETPRAGERMARLRRSIILAEAAEAAGHRTSEVAVDASGVYWLYPEHPRVAVSLGRDPDPTAAMARLDATLARLGSNLEFAREIDVGWVKQVVVRTKGVAARRVLTARLIEEANAVPALEPVLEVEELGRG
jgi:hypothetical protein